MNESYKYMNEIKKLRNKILDLLQNTLLIFNDENIFIENLEFFIDSMNNLIISRNINDLFSKEFLNKLLSLSFIFENSNSFIIKYKNSSLKLQNKYSLLLTEFLKASYADYCTNIIRQNKNEIRKNSSIFSRKHNNIGNNEEKKEEKNDNDFELLN